MISSPCLSPIGAKLTPYYSNKSANGRMELVIVSQPEEQHRARYLTEGSRGAIKDITGMGHPVVKLNGYYSRQPIKLECYIGHDKHNGLPHLFYQASKISGKNSTQCTACKVDGTSVIVMNLLPEHGMQATIDCIGILKERNVDVEQKLLNLNHASKMLDFTSSSSLMTTAEENSFQSFDTNSIDILDAQDSKSKLMNCSSSNNNISKSSSSSSNNSTPTALAINGCSGNKSRMSFQIHNENSNQSSVGPIRFGRNALNGSDTKMSPQMDENSMGAMSRADSLDDASSDVSRHSVINTISAFGTASGHLNSNYHFNALGGGGPGLAQQRSTTTTTTTTTTNNNNLHNNHHLLNQDTSTQDSQGMMVTTITNSTLAATNGLKPTQHQQSSASSASLLALNSRKRSVRCRLVFRVKIPETGEVLQTTSTPIICTQPLGTPEICKKSLTRAPLKPGNQLELFIIGKNFLKDSKVVFKSKQSDWIKVVEPEKEFLNSSHMICRVPNYDGPLDSISSANTNGHQANQQFVQLQQHEQDASQQHQMIEVELQVRSGGKFSEAHTFYYINNLSLPSQLQQQQQAPLAVTPPTLTQVVLTQQQQQPGPLATVIASQHQQQQQLPSSASSNSTTSTILQQQTSPPTPQNSPTTTSQTTIQTTQASMLTNGMTDQLLDQQQLISATNQNVVVALNQQLQQQQQQQQQQLTIYHQATKIESPPASTVISPQLQSPIGQQQQQQSSPPQQVVSTTQHLHAQQQQLHQDQQPQQHMQYVNQPRQDPQQQMQQQQLVTQQQQFEQHQQQLVAHQQQQQQAQAIQEQNQIHTQLMMQQHRQQQQRIQQTNRATIQLTAVDLNDENTVVYADSLQLTQHQQPQQQPPTTIVRSVHQDGLQQNGLTSGGIQQNGLQQNGLQQQQNGLAQNGTATIITGGMPQMDTSPALEQPQQLTGAEQITATTTGQFISHFHIIKQQQQQVAATIHHHQQQQFQAEQQSVALQHQQQQQQVQQQPQHFEMTQQQQTATTLQEQQQQLVLQHHQQRQQQQQQQQMQQQQQLVQNLDLNDDSTVVYVDGLHHLQADSSTPDALLFPCTFS